MSANLARTADGWWAVTPAGLVRLGLPSATTAELLADRAVLERPSRPRRRPPPRRRTMWSRANPVSCSAR